MTIPEIRLSPSGAPASSIGYVGLAQRMKQSVVSCANLAVLTTNLPILNTSSDEQILSLSDPNPALAYSAKCKFFVNKLTASSTQFIAEMQVRYTVAGVAGSWQTLNTSSVSDAADTQLGKRQFEIDYPIRMGNLSPGIPANCTLLEVRCVVRASAATQYSLANDGGSGVTGGAVYLELAEHVPAAA